MARTRTSTGEDLPRPEDAIRLSEAGELVDRDPATVYRWIQKGKLIGWRTGDGPWEVSRSAVLAQVRCHAASPELIQSERRRREHASAKAELERRGVGSGRSRKGQSLPPEPSRN